MEGFGAHFGRHLLPVPSLHLVEQQQRIPSVSFSISFRHDAVVTLIQNAGKTFPAMEIRVTLQAPWQLQVGNSGEPTKPIFIQKLGNPQLIPQACSIWFAPEAVGG